MPAGTPAASARKVALLCGLAFAAGFGALLVWVGGAASPVPDPRLGAAVRALSVPERPPRVARLRTERAFVTIPLVLRFDREQAVRLAIAINEGDPEPEWLSGRLASYLKLEPERARILACAFSSEGAVADADALRAAAAAHSWPHAEAVVADRYGVSAAQMAAFRCALCREALATAFDTLTGPERVERLLGVCAALAPVQVEAVLAIQAALELLRAGPEAEAALDALAEEHPHLAALMRQRRPQPGHR